MKRLGVYLKPYTLESILGPLFKLLEALLELLHSAFSSLKFGSDC